MATIAFIGLGNMGMPMATNLVKAGHLVKGFDVSTANLEAAVLHGVIPAKSAIEAAQNAEFLITMLPAGTHVLSVYQSIISGLGRGTIMIDCSTIDVESARSAHVLADQFGCLSLDAPVSGGTSGASAGSLTFMVGGQTEPYEKAAPVFQAMGKRIVHCGASGAGQAAKICNNMLLAISMIGVCEAFALGEKLGLSHQALFDVASVSSGQCWSLNTYCPVPGPVSSSPANNAYQPGFASTLMLKDLSLAHQATLDAGLESPLAAHAHLLYSTFVNEGHGASDFSAIIKTLRTVK